MENYQLIRFLCAGAVGVSLSYITLYGLTEWFGVWYMLSAVLGFFVNLTSNFILQRNWTFKSRSKNVGRQFVQYTILYGALFSTNLIVLYVFTEYVGLWYIAAQLIASVVCTIISFFSSRKILA